MKLLQEIGSSLLNADVSQLSNQIECLNTLFMLDQSCQLCRNISVRKSLTSLCAQASRKQLDQLGEREVDQIQLPV